MIINQERAQVFRGSLTLELRNKTLLRIKSARGHSSLTLLLQLFTFTSAAHERYHR